MLAGSGSYFSDISEGSAFDPGIEWAWILGLDLRNSGGRLGTICAPKWEGNRPEILNLCVTDPLASGEAPGRFSEKHFYFTQ